VGFLGLEFHNKHISLLGLHFFLFSEYEKKMGDKRICVIKRLWMIKEYDYE